MSDLRAVRPDGPLYRVARAPDTWAWPPWAYAGTDGTFGNRFDDPQASYRVIYASSTRLGAFVETLACFRVDLAVVAGLQEIEGSEEPLPSGLVPRRWLADRMIGEATVQGDFVDLGDAHTLAAIRARLAAQAIHHGLADIDAATIRLHAPRRFTQDVSRLIYECHQQEGGCAGIRYGSRLGDQFVNWAIFETPVGTAPMPEVIAAEHITPGDPDLAQALRLLDLTLADA